MANKSTTIREVKLFKDEETMGVQSVTIDKSFPDEIWLSVSHCGNELLMSLENWHKLVELVEVAKAKSKIK